MRMCEREKEQRKGGNLLHGGGHILPPHTFEPANLQPHFFSSPPGVFLDVRRRVEKEEEGGRRCRFEDVWEKREGRRRRRRHP